MRRRLRYRNGAWMATCPQRGRVLGWSRDLAQAYGFAAGHECPWVLGPRRLGQLLAMRGAA